MNTKEVLLNVGLASVGFIGVGALDKKFCPEKIKKFSGLVCIGAGVFLALKVKNNVLQVLGLGIAMYGIVKQISELTKNNATIAQFIPTLGEAPEYVGAVPRLFGQYPEETAVVGNPIDAMGDLSDVDVNEFGEIEGLEDDQMGDIDGLRRGVGKRNLTPEQKALYKARYMARRKALAPAVATQGKVF